VCNQQQKKTISADHVLMALDKLGFGDFVKEAEEVSEYKRRVIWSKQYGGPGMLSRIRKFFNMDPGSRFKTFFNPGMRDEK
jgi:hypothetical protein